MLYSPEEASRHWWLSVGGGIAAILFGLAVVLWPAITLSILLTVFGAYAIVYGLLALVAMFRAREAGGAWWTYLLIAFFGIVAGIVSFAYPGLTSVILAYVIAVWAIVTGIAEIVAFTGQRQWLFAVAGAISILFGLVLFSDARAGAVALIWIIGAFAIVRGILMLTQAMQGISSHPTRA